jgi:hypothetical protein
MRECTRERGGGGEREREREKSEHARERECTREELFERMHTRVHCGGVAKECTVVGLPSAAGGRVSPTYISCEREA